MTERILRTPDSQFERLLDYPFEPNYMDVGGPACITWTMVPRTAIRCSCSMVNRPGPTSIAI